ncbi:kinase-like protein [Xylaria arbuscula]|nr:kinase-like protein [Xylaria arbuscula]
MAHLSRQSTGHSSHLSGPPSDLSRQSSGHSSQDSIPSSYGSTGHDLYQQLSMRIVKCDKAMETQALSRVKFLPRDAVDEVITTGVVNSQLTWLPWPFSKSCDPAEAKEVKNLLAILGLCGMEKDFRDLFNEGVRDKHLPLARRNSRGYCNDLLSPAGDEFKTFSKRKNYESRVDEFLDKQWQVLAPVLTTSNRDIYLDGEYPLPFYDIKKISALNLNNTVYKGMLHAAHIIPQPSNNIEVAIKDYKDKKDFDKEKDNLLKIQNLNHPHLIRHIATIEQVQGNIFCVIFPWANGGNLAEFWERFPNGNQTRSPKLFIWSLQQMFGLVDAMFALHDMNYRHGDLKPENILHFKDSSESSFRESKLGTLVIADVGVSKLHHLATGLRGYGTDTKATTPCYEAPEAELDNNKQKKDRKSRSRRYDMWSIGCIFMEFAIWLLYGHKAIDNFKHQRKQTENDPRAHMAAYYTRTGDTAIINSAVSKGLKALENDPRCAKGTGLESLINLIEKDLIVIDPDQRIKAESLRDKVGSIVQRAEKDSAYLMRRTEPPPRVPRPFGEDYG